MGPGQNHRATQIQGRLCHFSTGFPRYILTGHSSKASINRGKALFFFYFPPSSLSFLFHLQSVTLKRNPCWFMWPAKVLYNRFLVKPLKIKMALIISPFWLIASNRILATWVIDGQCSAPLGYLLLLASKWWANNVLIKTDCSGSSFCKSKNSSGDCLKDS